MYLVAVSVQKAPKAFICGTAVKSIDSPRVFLYTQSFESTSKGIRELQDPFVFVSLKRC